MKMTVLPSAYVHHSAFFNYMTEDEKQLNVKRIEDKAAIVVGYEENEYVKFAAIIDLDCPDRIHVREVCGHFVKKIGMLEIFATALARVMKKSFLSFNTEKDGVEWIGANMGFAPDEKGEFVKRVA